MGFFSKSTPSNTAGGGFTGGIVTATKMRNTLEQFLDGKGMKYTVLDGADNILYLAFGGRHETFVLVDFDENEPCDSAHFSSNGFAKVVPGKNAEALVKLNQLNKRFRWVKFWMDDEGKITADCDAVLEIGTVGEECLQVILRLSNIIEDALDELKGTAEMDAEQKMQLDLVATIKRMGGA